MILPPVRPNFPVLKVPPSEAEGQDQYSDGKKEIEQVEVNQLFPQQHEGQSGREGSQRRVGQEPPPTDDGNACRIAQEIERDEGKKPADEDGQFPVLFYQFIETFQLLSLKKTLDKGTSYDSRNDKVCPGSQNHPDPGQKESPEVAV